ncbi:MAG TPA: hypothetical protein VN026_17410 [Bacteroidia bacterium]|nr:hypothetical protein [Bacteroidia bacterium]
MDNTGLKIIIHQALHGYLNGHQLLACSRELNIVEKKMLLFQSDLSGSMVDTGFETYLTGYPVTEGNFYVLARTWYAKEMERPGCVWTQSLLIDFSDLGKISEFEELLFLFNRPQKGEFGNYSKPLTFQLQSESQKRKISHGEGWSKLSYFLYENPDKSILVPSISSDKWDLDVLNIWSDQWPRLRRNFTFCTGALSLKTVNEKEFDIQIVPERNLSSVQRQSTTGNIYDSNVQVNSDWLSIYYKHPKANIRKFLWSFGAENDGERRNFIPLIKLFATISDQDFDILRINEYINSYFPSAENGKFLKKSLYGNKSILPISEKELLTFLLTTDQLPTFEAVELQIPERIVSLINEGNLSETELINIILYSKRDRFERAIWERIDLPDRVLINLIEKDQDLCDTIAERWPRIAVNPYLWKLNESIQKKIIYALLKSTEVKWRPIIYSILESQSQSIFVLRKELGSDVSIISLDWQNERTGYDLLNDWAKYIMEREDIIVDWLKDNRDKFSRGIYLLLFTYLSPKKLEYLSFDAKTYIKGYEDIKGNGKKEFVNNVSCKLLAVGLSNGIKGSYLLVERTLPLVFNEVYSNSISEGIWKIISKEYAIEDDNDFNLFDPSSYFPKNKKYRFNASYWDIARHLVIKVVNQYVRRSWSTQSYIAAFSGKREFKESLLYLLTFEKGQEFISNMFDQIKVSKVRISKEQEKVIRTLFDD